MISHHPSPSCTLCSKNIKPLILSQTKFLYHGLNAFTCTVISTNILVHLSRETVTHLHSTQMSPYPGITFLIFPTKYELPSMFIYISIVLINSFLPLDSKIFKNRAWVLLISVVLETSTEPDAKWLFIDSVSLNGGHSLSQAVWISHWSGEHWILPFVLKRFTKVFRFFFFSKVFRF